MNIETVLRLFNEEKKSLKEIGIMFNVSKSTVQRFITKAGYIYNSSSKLYETPLIINDSFIDKQNVSRETIENEKQLNSVPRETIESEKMVNGSYVIPISLQRALKLKAVLEDKKVIDIVREAIQNAVEQKYYNI